MRSAVVAGLVLLAACKPAEQAPAEPSASSVESIDLRGGTSDPPALPPTLPGDLRKAPPTLPVDVSKAPISVPADNPLKGKHYQAMGTEPFWSLEVLPGKLIYTSPEVMPGIAVTYAFTNIGTQMRYSGTLLGKPMMLTIEPGKCSDGMSDTIYPYKASFTWGDSTEQGCARLK